MKIGGLPVPEGGLEVEMLGITKRFGSFTALDDVSLHVRPGSFHALLGENGAGKSTLVKCLVGYHPPEAGQILVARREHDIRSPHDAHALGVGMVYQHFTLVPSMTVAENLVMSRDEVPGVIRWRDERDRLEAFMKTVPFQVPLDTPVSALAAGEKQKTEILKLLYLQRRFMILDEPTSVLTPQEADEVLGMLRDMTREGRISVLIITHKFREVMAFADRVTVLRRGRLAGDGEVADLDAERMAEMMIGKRETKAATRTRSAPPQTNDVRLAIRALKVSDDAGRPAVDIDRLEVRSGEIVGIAGVSGNGQRQLVEALVGQRPREAGTVEVHGESFGASRAEMRRHRVYALPEEPLRNACVPSLSVAENMALRRFDRTPLSQGGFMRWGTLRREAQRLIGEYQVKTRGPESPIRSLSGGNVQRAVLARELSDEVSVLIVANPVFGLDFAAVADIHERILAARDRGAAVLLVSEDLDELLELSDRVVVMFDGRLVHQTPIESVDIGVVGRAMAGHAEAVH